MILYPNAKINLGLRILEKRPDGFHNIETLFVPVDICDILEFVPAQNGKPGIEITGIELDSDPADNLVMRAWHLMNEVYGISPLKIHLHKIIPVGAGLGGGSADAAFMLVGLSDFFRLDCEQEQLEQYAAMLGSDCPFFIRNKPALGTGRGEVLTDTELPLDGFEVLLVNPDIHISTSEAYSGVVPVRPDRTLKDLIHQDVASWQSSVLNDFEAPVFSKYPRIADIKAKLLAMGAAYASMSGSGSTVYGLFHEGSLEEERLDFRDCQVFRGRIRQY